MNAMRKFCRDAKVIVSTVWAKSEQVTLKCRTEFFERLDVKSRMSLLINCRAGKRSKAAVKRHKRRSFNDVLLKPSLENR